MKLSIAGVFSTSLGVIGVGIAFYAEQALRRSKGDWLMAYLSVTGQSGPNGDGESLIGPISAWAVDYERFVFLCLLVAGLCGVAAVVSAQRSWRRGDRSHFAASGIAIGVLSIAWESKLAVDGS